MIVGQLDQLWYTWSEFGVDTIEVGFRIRAASEGLHDFRSERVQNLDPYQRYSLPHGTESMKVERKDAPVCLSLIRPEGLNECVLVHKAYTGKDGFGRDGAFFIHLLAGLPVNFSARAAIILWGSSFWQTSDEELKNNPYNTVLPRAVSTELWDGKYAFNFQDRGSMTAAESVARDFLPFLIQAFLEKHPRIEDKTVLRSGCFPTIVRIIRALTFHRPAKDKSSQTVQQEKIYIAAADRDVAFLIYALTSCLPRAFVDNLTFSTYERDPSAAPVEIVGTCWLGHNTVKTRRDSVGELFPNEFDQKKLVLDCYTGKFSSLNPHPLIVHRPLAEEYARDARKYFLLSLTKEYQQFVSLSRDKQRSFVREKPKFSLLLAFARLFEEADRVKSPLDVDTFLDLYERIVLKPEQVSDKMLDELIAARYLEDIADHLSQPAYQEALVRRVLNDNSWWQHVRAVVQQWQQQSLLEQALIETSQQCMQFLVDLVGKGSSTTEPVDPEVFTNESLQLFNGVNLLYCMADQDAIWLDLLDEFAQIKHVYYFISRNQQTYSYLMERWTKILPPTDESVKRIRPLRPPLYAGFSIFLDLHLSALWKGIIIKDFLENTRSHKPFTDLLEEKYHEDVKTLFNELVQDEQSWVIATTIFKQLAADSYERKLALLFVLLDAPPARNAQAVCELVQSIKFARGERAPFLMHFGPRYLRGSVTARLTIEILRDLAKDDSQNDVQHREKMDVLLSWLDDRELASWFGEQTPQGVDLLDGILNAAELTPEESEAFLRSYGPKYAINYPTPNILTQLLSSYAQDYKQRLLTIDIDLWQQNNASTALGEEEFLLFLSKAPLSPDYQRIFYCWYVLSCMIREPHILQRQPEVVAQRLGYLLGDPNLAGPTHDQIIEKLAIACIVGGNELPRLIERLKSYLTELDISQLCQVIDTRSLP